MKRITLIPAFISGLITLGIILPASSQITSDKTTNTTVNQINNNFNILNGIQKGNNLFHSFKEFSIPTGTSATFQTKAAIENIINRVTGGNISNIDGLIKANGNANLFLINPAGIIFGENAKLDIGGSFLATTAESILFEDGFNYSAIDSQQTPLLTVSVPMGLQMGTNPGVINNQGAILQVKSGNTLALVGGDINQTGGELIVAGGGGSIELASLDDSNQIKFKQDQGKLIFDSSNTNSFRDIQLTQTLVDGSGEGSASVNAIARNFLLSDNSIFQGNNQGATSGGDITINASSSILVEEDSEFLTETNGVGNAGNMFFYAPNITFKNNADIVTVAVSGSGKAGDITFKGQQIKFFSDPELIETARNSIISVTLDAGNGSQIKMIADDNILFYPGSITNFTSAEGNSGTTILKAKTIEIFSGGGATVTRGSGNGGDLNFIADSFYMEDAGFSASSTSEQSGKAGDISISAKSIIMRDSAGFSNGTSGTGQAGNISFKSDYIEINNSHLNSRTTGSGSGGNIDISTENLRLLDGGQLNVTTSGKGNAGNIYISANTVELNAEPQKAELSQQSTGIISSALPNLDNLDTTVKGSGGNINLNSSSVVVRDGALISASTSVGNGNGGDITLEASRLDLLDGGQIMNLTRSGGNAGTINLKVGDRILVSGSDGLHEMRQSAYIPGQRYWDVEYNIGAFSGIYANATQTALGNGGNLKITAGELQIQDKAKITVSSQGSGSAGSLIAKLDTLKLSRAASLEAESNGSNGNLSLDIEKALIIRQNSKITTNAIGTANGGNITINSPIIAGFENSDIIANAVEGNGGNIDITTQGIFGLNFRDKLSLESDITASSEFGINGTVEINNINIDPDSGLVELPKELIDSSQQIAQGCSNKSDNSFIATGKGGIPQNPNQYLYSTRTWSDIRNLLISSKRNNYPVENTQESDKPAIVEATGFIRNQKGEIELVAVQNMPFTTQVPSCSGTNT